MGPKRAVEIPITPREHSALLYLNTSTSNKLDTMLALGPNLHYSVFDAPFSPQSGSPTSLGMYNSWKFAHWKDSLVNQGMNLEDFINHEIDQHEIDSRQRQRPLTEASQKRNTLHTLFTWNIQRDFLLVMKSTTTATWRLIAEIAQES